MPKEKKETFIQVGFTALRDPTSGGYLPAVPLYIKAEEGAAESEQGLIEDIGNLLARRMKAYVDGCKQAGISLA